VLDDPTVEQAFQGPVDGAHAEPGQRRLGGDEQPLGRGMTQLCEGFDQQQPSHGDPKAVVLQQRLDLRLR